MIKKLSVVLVAIFVVIGILWWTGTFRSAPEPNTQIRIAYRPLALADVTPVILQEAGLSEPGVTVQLIAVPSPQIALQRFDAGEVDAIAGLTMEAVLQRLAERGDPGFRAYFFQVDVKDQGWVSLVANRRLGDVQVRDLAGKTVASLPTNQARFLVRRILQSAGVPDAQIHIVDYNPATPLLGMESGEHDALFGLEPAISRAAAQGHRVIARGPVSNFVFNGKQIPLSASVVRTQFVQEHPDGYNAFVALMTRAAELQKSKPEQVREYFAKSEYGGLPPEVRGNLALPNIADPRAEGVLQNLRDFVSELRKGEILKNDIDVSILIK